MGALDKWFGFSIGAKALDIITTLYIIYNIGPEAESHPFTAGMISTYGVVPGLLINGAIVSILLWALYKHKRKKLLIVSTVLLMSIVLVNAVTIILNIVEKTI